MVYRRHPKQLERFHKQCLRSVLGIHWITHTPDTEVLEKANTISIEAHVHRHRLRWVGHVIRLDDDRIPKQLLYGELSVDSRSQQKPKKRFKDCVKDSLALCKSRSGLARHLKIHQAPGSGEHKGKAQPKDFVCCVCGRVCKSLAGFKSHCRSHDQ